MLRFSQNVTTFINIILFIRKIVTKSPSISPVQLSYRPFGFRLFISWKKINLNQNFRKYGKVKGYLVQCRVWRSLALFPQQTQPSARLLCAHRRLPMHLSRQNTSQWGVNEWMNINWKYWLFHLNWQSSPHSWVTRERGRPNCSRIGLNWLSFPFDNLKENMWKWFTVIVSRVPTSPPSSQIPSSSSSATSPPVKSLF